MSIGIVAENGREYYAESADANWDNASEWVSDNVLPYLGGVMKRKAIIAEEIADFIKSGSGKPEFWAFCGAYDWVVLNQLYGAMVDHPKSWPFYCNDIAQYALYCGVGRHRLPKQDSATHHALNDARWTKQAWEFINAAD